MGNFHDEIGKKRAGKHTYADAKPIFVSQGSISRGGRYRASTLPAIKLRRNWRESEKRGGKPSITADLLGATQAV